MDAKELRIGNYIQDDKSRILEVDGVKKDDTIGFEIEAWPINGGGIVSLPLKPIPLTEEWLICFGFEKETHGFYKYSIEVRINGNIVTMLGHKTSLRNIGINTKYVHQLQNLYYSLTGEELTKK